MSSFVIEEVTDATKLEALAQTWDALHASCGDAGLFTTHLWLTTWWAHLSARRTMRVLVIREGAVVRGIVPLCLRRMGPGGSPVWKLEFLGTGQNDFTDFLIPAPSAALWDAVVAHLAGLRPRWQLLDFRQLPETSPNRVELEQALARHGYVVRVRPDEHCPAIRMEGTWEEYLESKFSGKSRYQLRRKAKAAAARGEVRIRCVTAPGELPAALDAVERVEAREVYAGRPRISIFDRPAPRAFYRAVAPKLAERQWMHLSILEIGGHLAAYRFGFRHAGRHYDYFHDYDPAYADASPGMVLMMDLLERCFGDGLKEFDFLRGDESYKAQWCTHVARCVRLMAFPPTLGGRLVGRVYAARERSSNLASGGARPPGGAEGPGGGQSQTMLGSKHE